MRFPLARFVCAGIAGAGSAAPAVAQLVPSAAPAPVAAQPSAPILVGQSSSFAIFLADKDTDGTRELFRAALNGSGTSKLHPPLTSGAGVTDAWLAPDGSKVAYVQLDQLHIAQVDGSGSVNVSGPGIMNAAVQSDDPGPWSPNSQWLAYRHAAAQSGVLDLWAVRPNGTGKVNLSQIALLNGDVQTGWSWAPDSSRVAFVSDRVIDNMAELHTATPDGSGFQLIEGGWGNPTFDVSSAEWSPDATRLGYYGGFPGASGVLRTCDPVGGGKQNVSPLASHIIHWSWSPSSQSLAWIDNNATGKYRLYAAAPDGSGTVTVSSPMQPQGDVTQMRWSPDSQRIAYRADADTDNVSELYSGLASGAGAVKLNGPLPSGFLDMFEWHWSPDGEFMSYVAIQTLGKVELFVSAADGSSNVAVNGPLVAGGSVGMFGSPWSPDGTRLAFVADKLALGVRELFTTSATGSGTVLVSFMPASGGDVQVGPQWTANSQRLVFQGDLGTNDVFELHAGWANGSGASAISETLVPGGDVSAYSVP